jgi:PDZ domain-containing protein
MWEFPEPPGVEPVRGVHPWLWLIGAALSVALLAGAFFLPIPIFFSYLPGPVRDVEKLVEVEDARTYSSEGSLYLTTVSVDTQVTLVDIVKSIFDKDTAVVMQQDVTGGQSLEQLRRQQRQEIVASKRQAQQVALAALGFSRPEGDGARVRATVADAPAHERLLPGDVIIEIDGKRTGTTCDVGRSVDAHEIGEPIEVGVRRDGDLKSFRLETAANPQDPTSSFLGVVMEDVNYRFDPGFEITFATGEIAGPSAGLMFSLALYDRLTPDDLTGGRQIAGTGTIDCDGGVGPIGGIEQKIAGAENKGAEIFLAPQANAAAAKAVADEIEVVAISTFDDAIAYLENLE